MRLDDTLRECRLVRLGYRRLFRIDGNGHIYVRKTFK